MVSVSKIDVCLLMLSVVAQLKGGDHVVSAVVSVEEGIRKLLLLVPQDSVEALQHQLDQEALVAVSGAASVAGSIEVDSEEGSEAVTAAVLVEAEVVLATKAEAALVEAEVGMGAVLPAVTELLPLMLHLDLAGAEAMAVGMGFRHPMV